MKTKNLTARDLMIGDWVSINNKPHKVTGIQICDGIMCVQTDYTDTYYSIENYEPIPLTAEILMKNNFEKHYDDDIIIYTHPQGIIIEMDINYKLFDDGHFFVMGIQQRFYFVHELQRALKLLKINKDIVL